MRGIVATSASSVACPTRRSATSACNVLPYVRVCPHPYTHGKLPWAIRVQAATSTVHHAVDIAALTFLTSIIRGTAVFAHHSAGWRTTENAMKRRRAKSVPRKFHMRNSQFKCTDDIFFEAKQVCRTVTVSWFPVRQFVTKLYCHGNITPSRRPKNFYAGRKDPSLGQNFVGKQRNEPALVTTSINAHASAGPAQCRCTVPILIQKLNVAGKFRLRKSAKNKHLYHLGWTAKLC
jgi:hypothetical protein